MTVGTSQFEVKLIRDKCDHCLLSNVSSLQLMNRFGFKKTKTTETAFAQNRINGYDISSNYVHPSAKELILNNDGDINQ